MHRSAWLYLFFVALFSAACDKTGDPTSAAEQQEQDILRKLSENTITAYRHDSGFYYYPTVTNTNGRTQVSGKVLSIYYRLTTLDGGLVAEHVNGDPITLEQGSGTIYPPGLDVGLGLMREGESFVFLFPSHLAYDKLGVNEQLPPHSIARFEVELLEIQNTGEVFTSNYRALTDYLEERDLNDPDTVIAFGSGLRMVKTREDHTAQLPGPGDEVGINWTGYFADGQSFGAFTGNDIFRFTLGESLVVEGLEEGVLNLRLGERAILLLPSEIAYGPGVGVIPPAMKDILVDKEIIPAYGATIPPFSPLIFEVELRTIE